ncbi:glycosyltransferase family 2 protein [Acinetobacter sp. CUI P1]|nr:glycosyltransferase family 2 protein [Acinetobacter sp. CUI P1]
MNQIKFSIIIPIYKVEKYITQCINSVILQTYQNIEIILVDDGSPDSCPEICDNYSENDIRIKVIHKHNEGLSSARNEGINIATGDFLIFLDSDDWIESDFVENIWKSIHNIDPDIVVINVRSYFENRNTYIEKKYSLTKSELYSGVEAYEYLYENSDFWGAAWQFVVKRSFLQEINLKFVNGIYHEDERYSPELLLSANKISFCNTAFYVNRSGRDGSIVNSLNIKKEFDKLFIIEDLLEFAGNPKNLGLKSQLLRARCAQIYLGLIKSFYNYLNSNENELVKLRKEIKKMRVVLSYNNKFKYKVINFFLIFFGLEFTARIMNLRGSYDGN